MIATGKNGTSLAAMLLGGRLGMKWSNKGIWRKSATAPRLT
jgi:hypothetical protein